MINPFQLNIKEKLIWTDTAPLENIDLLNSKRAQRPLTQHFIAVVSDLDKLVNAADVKVTGFLAEHNLLFATSVHLGLLFKNIFPEL